MTSIPETSQPARATGASVVQATLAALVEAGTEIEFPRGRGRFVRFARTGDDTAPSPAVFRITSGLVDRAEVARYVRRTAGILSAEKPSSP